jgi:hypothetical protein
MIQVSLLALLLLSCISLGKSLNFFELYLLRCKRRMVLIPTRSRTKSASIPPLSSMSAKRYKDSQLNKRAVHLEKLTIVVHSKP